jgi:hypothetical protein
MAEPTSRIEPTSSFREPDSDGARRNRDKRRPKIKPPDDSEEVAGGELEDQEKHTLDTLA